jgi:superfamily I DNA/RNA helicase
VQVAHFHDLCYRLGRQAGIELPDQQVSGMPESYFTEQLPEALSRAVSTLGSRYDAIVVDEGQDFQDVWWVPLIELLRDPQHGILYICFDDRQDLYRRPRLWPIPDEPFELTVNCRSTQLIHRRLQETMPGRLGEVVCVGPEGRPVESLYFETDGIEKDALRKALHRLINDERVAPTDVVVLTPRAQAKSKWHEGAIIGNQRLTWSTETADPAAVQVSTIHSFKGLERPVVIMTELVHLPRGHEPELLYVGRSRARNQLIELWQQKGSSASG